MIPPLPDLDEPELNTSRPLDPLIPPFADRTPTSPLLDELPSLPAQRRPPPEKHVLLPGRILSLELAPLVPLPLLTSTAPPRPPEAERWR